MTKIIMLITMLCQDPSVSSCKQKYFTCYKSQERLGKTIDESIQYCFKELEFKKSLRKPAN